MRRPFTRALALAATAAVIPLVNPVPASADVVIGGYPVEISESPWTVALSSRDRFGGTRAGQFCGGVVIGRSTVLTAAHCLSQEVLGEPPRQVRDLRVVAGRGDLLSDEGREIAVRETWINPRYDSYTQRRRLRRAHPRGTAGGELGHPYGGPRPGRLRARHRRCGLRLGGYGGGRRLRRAFCGPHRCRCWQTRSARRPIRAARTERISLLPCCAPGSRPVAGTPVRGTVAARWSLRGG